MNVEATSTFWIGLDDTDEREHGCTTHDFNDLLNTLTDSDIQIHDARLVRLWPFAPQRTRGNAALAAAVQCGDSHLLERILGLWFESKYHAIVDDGQEHSAQPTLLMTRAQLPENLYWETVRNHVELQQRMIDLAAVDFQMWNTDTGYMGVIGASAAIAWRGECDWTWECTAWRQSIGKRNVPSGPVIEMAEKFPGTILNRDPNANRSLIAPRTPCPVLYGIRGEEKSDVLNAHDFLQKYPVEQSKSHRAFRSNQATGDHLEGSQESTVISTQVMQGGHVEIDVGESLLVFSQGGPVNKLAQSLQPGDKISWYGMYSNHAYHLEKLRLIRGERNFRRPKCACGTRYKSKGVNQKLRCPNCDSEVEEYWDFDVIESSWVEPPIASRRHLSKPLNRIGKSEC